MPADRFGAGTWPSLLPGREVSQPATAPAHARTVLYWKDPDGRNDFAAEARKTADGRDYLPVYEDEEAGFVSRSSSPEGGSTGKETKQAKQQAGRKILDHRNPMGLPDVSHAPKKESMGMD